MFPDKAEETEMWIQSITKAIDHLKNPSGGGSSSKPKVEIKAAEEVRKPDPTPAPSSEVSKPNKKREGRNFVLSLYRFSSK